MLALTLQFFGLIRMGMFYIIMLIQLPHWPGTLIIGFPAQVIDQSWSSAILSVTFSSVIICDFALELQEED